MGELIETPDLTVRMSHQVLDDMIFRALRLSCIEYPSGAKSDLLHLQVFLKQMKDEAIHGA